MGIRFKCHLCHSPLNVKNDLAQKRGVCPKCNGKFRIPMESQDFSLSLDAPVSNSTKALSYLDSEIISANSVAVKPTEAKKTSQEPSLLKPAAYDATNREQIETEQTPSMTDELYFVRPPSGGEYGPADKATIELWVTQRRITSETMICKLGASQWKKAREVFASLFDLRN